jgi:1-acyl-sn-glycerol-3-phosphate acyltransferase
MLRMLFISVFLSLYILILGPPLLLYTLVTRHIDPLYWAGVKGVMFFVRAVGIRVRVVGREKIPRAFAFSQRITLVPRMLRRWLERFRGGLRCC